MTTNFKLVCFLSLFINISFLAFSEEIIPAEEFLDYPHLTSEMIEEMTPYLIPENHRMKARLDEIFGSKRVTANRELFRRSGFKILDQGPRSYIVVAKHKNLPGKLIKCYFDEEKREKWNKPSWYWLCKRCEGARKIAEIIKKYRLKHFSVPNKHIYILPPCENTDESCYARHPALLLVTDMNLVSQNLNLHAWKNFVDEEVLQELYIIITLAKGASYRADNIAYSYSRKFCFIDCEYPSKGPEYHRITSYLNESMQAYWLSLVERGELLRQNNAEQF